MSFPTLELFFLVIYNYYSILKGVYKKYTNMYITLLHRYISIYIGNEHCLFIYKDYPVIVQKQRDLEYAHLSDGTDVSERLKRLGIEYYFFNQPIYFEDLFPTKPDVFIEIKYKGTEPEQYFYEERFFA